MSNLGNWIPSISGYYNEEHANLIEAKNTRILSVSIAKYKNKFSGLQTRACSTFARLKVSD